jgi:hypothetical protein
MTTKTLADYIQQAEAWVDTPARGDDFAINIREECLVESHIVDVVEDGVVLAADDRMIEILESYGMLEAADPYRREVSPPSPEEFEEDVAEAVPRTDMEIDRRATLKYAEEIKQALVNATGANVDTNLNQDGSVQIVINPQSTNRKLGYIVPNEKGVGATARSVSAAIEQYYRGFRQKGWRFDQPTQGQFTIAVPQQGVAEGSGFDQEAGIGIDGKSFKFKIRDLVALANKYPVTKINPRQFQDQLDDREEDPTQSMARVEKADLQYPIIVVKRQNGQLWIADGTHRAHKAILNKLPSIKAKIIPIKDMALFDIEQGVAEGSLDTPGIEESQAELARIQELAGMPPAAMPSVQEGAMKNWLDDLYYEFQERHDLPRDIDDDAYLGVVAKFLRDQGVDPDRIEDIGELFLDRRDREEDDDHDYANQLDRELYDDEPMMEDPTGKEIDYTSLVVDGIDTRDYPDFADAYFASGEYMDGTPIPDEVLDELTQDGDLLYDHIQKRLYEAEYHGRNVSLGKPFLTPDGPKKRSVYVKNPKGNVVKVNFGDKKLRIKKSNPKRRKSFRARHNCANPGPRHKARYWSCRAW